MKSSTVLLLTSLLPLAAGCASNHVELLVEEGDYRTISHPFTDAGAERARQMAMRSCNVRKRVAVQTSSACSLDRCTTHFQCMSRDDAAASK